MKKLRLVIAAAFLLPFAVNAAPASQASIEKLMELTNTVSSMDALYLVMEKEMRKKIVQATQGKSLSPRQHQAINTFSANFVKLIREQFSWEKLKPYYADLYRETFQQEEIDGMLAFYASPAGRAMTERMPILIGKSMEIAQSIVNSASPSMSALLRSLSNDLGVPGLEFFFENP